jgi:hypothetical protein
MRYEFFADAIDLGIDDAEEVRSVTLTQTAEGGGPSENYLLLQRSVAGIRDSVIREPYIEFNDAANGRFAGGIASAELLPTYIHFQFKPDSRVSAHPGASADEIDDLVVRFDADGPLLRRMKYALELVIAGGFPWKSIA